MPELFDLIVVGGGCNGTGIARDAAMRGLKVLLLEKNDFASGTTGASSGMIHGGPRYLLSDVKTTKLSSQDAGHIRNIAPHLIFRIPFLYPVLKGDKPLWRRKIRLSLVETFFQAYDRYSALKGGKPHTRLNPAEARELEPALSSDLVGAVTFDEWGINTQRLCIANALAADQYGATIRNHTEVLQVMREGGEVSGVKTRNGLTGEESLFRSKILFNATGPWADQFGKMAGVRVPLRPAKGIHLVLDRRITNVAVVSRCIDGREIFINPHENSTLLGTTDDDYYGNLDEIPVTQDEIEYLLQGMEQSYPEIRKARIVRVTRGVRPTLFGRDVYEDELSRGHKLFDHESEGAKGFISLAGGKLAAYRQIAEESTDLVCKKLKLKAQSSTHLVPLPGGDQVPTPEEIAKKYQIHPYTARRAIARHGNLVHQIFSATITSPQNKAILCPSEPVTAAETRYSIQKEWAKTLGDLERRTGLATGACQGLSCLLPALSLLFEEKTIPGGALDYLQELKDYLEKSWRRRAPLFESQGAWSQPLFAQEEMLRMNYLCVLQLEGL